MAETPDAIAAAKAAGSGWLAGNPKDYDRTHALDVPQLFQFLHATQPETLKKLGIADYKDAKTSTGRSFSPGSPTRSASAASLTCCAKAWTTARCISICSTARPRRATRRRRRSLPRTVSASRASCVTATDETRRALDLCLFINGLPIATFELKNSLTKQTVEDAIEQYRRDRDPREKLFEFGRCVVHFAVDDAEVRMCTELRGKGSWFLPFNKGWNDGAGNPPNPAGLKTDYLWKEVLTPPGLTNILENYAQIVEEKNAKTGQEEAQAGVPALSTSSTWCVRSWPHVSATWCRARGISSSTPPAAASPIPSPGWRTNSSASSRDEKEIFDSVIVVTDRRILDDQIQKTVKQFMQVGATVGHAEHSGDLRKFIEEGKKIIISTVQKFPFILDEIEKEAKGKTFAIIIDEAHSSQGGKTSSAMSAALADPEDTVNDALEKRMQARKMLTNASYFAFTATPKNKTLEMFGQPLPPDAEGKVKHRPFHTYTMKQAIQEGFILDVLKSYTPVDSYYKLVKKIEGDPEFDTKRAQKKLRKYVESHDHAIRLKAEIMVDHFHEQVMALNKIGGKARAMVVCSGIERAVQYFHAFKAYLAERKSPYQAIVAFSGEHEFGGAKVSESSLNGFPSGDIADKIQEDPYRFLICADKFQTGYDEPLLHTMYVDKPLSGIKAVQTLSRLNRAHPEKHDVFVLDFQNNTETITLGVCRLLPHDGLERGNRSQQAARPQGRAGQRAGVFPRAGASAGGLVPVRRGARQARPHPRQLRGRLPAARRGRPGGFQGQGQDVRPHLRFPCLSAALHESGVGEALHRPEPAHPETACAQRRRPLEGHSGSDRHGQLPR